MYIILILSIPIILAVISVSLKKAKSLGILNALGYFILFMCSLCLVRDLVAGRQNLPISSFFYIDALSIYFIFVVSVVNFASALYSISYIGADVREEIISIKKCKLYYILFNLFSFTMYFVTVINNLGLLWVAIEMTTLTSAFLVGFYNTKTAVEAAWKYIIICSVGIILALFGTILFYYNLSLYGGIRSLNWTDMVSVAGKLDRNILKIAFLFILVGYGTKAGLAPMHTWLPDAHSQALTPISALLSGVLLKTAVYAILRFTVVVNRCIGDQFSGNLFILFGLLSLGISAGFILIQKDIKRLLAYSSVEHIGIIFVGLGFGGVLGICGALLHIFNHAVTKSLMFFGAGNIVKKYKTNNMHVIKGVISVMPFTGTILILGIFALTGSPPFSIFISEIIVLVSGFTKSLYFASSLLLFFIVIIFGAMIYHFSSLIFGKKPEEMSSSRETISGKAAFLFLFIFICGIGVFIPDAFNKLLSSAVHVLTVK